MTLPNFLIIGAQKAGTTWLVNHLRTHPDVFLYPKEIHYFDSKSNYPKGLKWYQGHFDGVITETAIGEKTPEYLWVHNNPNREFLPDVHTHVHEILPDAKLIITLRNPVERAISNLIHKYRKQKISPIFSPNMYLAGNKYHLIEPYGILERGLYYDHIQAYRAYYPANQMLVLIYEEDIVQSPEAGMRKVCRFLEIDDAFPFKNLDKKIHASRESRPGLLLDYYLPSLHRLARKMNRLFGPSTLRPSAKVVDQLYRMYRGPHEKLFTLLGRQIDAWMP